MQRYWWPGYEMQLLGELQRQQNSTQFCDTLLQTEGISVPTHSCILAALSPYLSQKLSAAPSPPSGQKRQLQLQPVKAQTLLKLVGLLYSGEVEVKGSVEQNDVLAVARLFGIRELVEGHKNGKMEGELQEKMQLFGCSKENNIHPKGSEREGRRKMQDAQVQAEMAGRRDVDSPAENRSYVTTGTQTGEKSVGSCITCFSQASTPECAPSVAQHVDFSSMLQPRNITLDEQFCSTSCPVIPSMTSGARNDAKSTLNRSSCVINFKSTSALSNNTMTFPLSLNDDTNSFTSSEDSTYQQSSEYGKSLQAQAKKTMGLGDEKTNGHIPDSRENTEETRQASRDEILGEENGKSTEKGHLHASVGTKNLAKMKQMQQMLETTQISIKVKLRRRTKGEVWEVVSPQDTDETLSVLASYKQDGSSHKGLQTQPPPSTEEPDILIVQPHPNTSCGCQPPSSDCFNPNQRDGLGTAPRPQPQGSVEESDEQIEKLLEDIMMGLNILPNLEKDCKKSRHLQPNHVGVPTIGQVPVTQNNADHSQMHAAVSAAGCAFYQDMGTQSGHTSSDTAQDQSDTSLSVVQPDAAVIQQQLQCSPQYHSSVRSMGYRGGMSCESMPLSKSQECLQPEEPVTKSVIPSAFSAGQKQHYLTLQEPPRQDNQHILEYLATVTGVETQSLDAVSLPCMDDLRIPRCLSPLEPCTSATKHQAVLNQVNLSDKIQQQSSLHGRPWLTENPGSLQFPLSAITHVKSKSASLQYDTNCLLKQQQEEQKNFNPQNRETWAESCSVKQVEWRETISGGQQGGAELKSEPRKMKESLKCKQGDTSGDAVASKKRKRTNTSHLQDAASLSACQDVRVGEGTKGKINLSSCSVSLSSNNVLVKEREMATSSLNITSRFIGNQPSSITESLRKKTAETTVNTDQTRIRTRGFMKKTQESPSNTNPQNSSVPMPVACRAKIVNNGEMFPRRKRGRPPKAKGEELTPPDNNPAVVEEKSSSSESREQIDKDFSKEDLEERDKTKRRCIKEKRSGNTEVEVKTTSTENTPKPDVNNNYIIPAVRKFRTPRRPRMVTLKEFQRLIKLQRSKTRKSKESQETNGRDAECEGTARGDIASKESCKENQSEIFNQSAAEKSQQDATDSSTNVDTSLFCDNSVFPCDALQEEAPQFADEWEQPLKNPDEVFSAGKSCNTAASNTTQETDIESEGSSHTDSHLPQENRVVSDNAIQNVYPKTADRTAPHLPDLGGMSRTSGCDQDEEEEVEVDVLLFSPDRAPQAKECENGFTNMEITPDEEEEEDVNEIDVTGDEAE